jgi:hypothetical protein
MNIVTDFVMNLRFVDPQGSHYLLNVTQYGCESVQTFDPSLQDTEGENFSFCF